MSIIDAKFDEKNKSFLKAVENSNNNKTTRTTNGMTAHVNTSNYILDLFSQIGSSRGRNLSLQFINALNSNSDLAIRTLLWSRDILKGAGERQQFKDLLCTLEKINPELVIQILPKIPELGRWDDLFCLKTKQCRTEAFNLYEQALKNGNALAAKWAPREKSARKKDAYSLRKHLNLTPKEYRKLLVNNTDVVEQKMCANEWEDIEFEKVPSIAAYRYQSAFQKHAPFEYSDYLEDLESGLAKVNAKTLTPVNVVRSIYYNNSAVGNAQWEALPNYMNGALVLPMVDVSLSMGTFSYTGKPSPLQIAVSLGLYISDKNTGPFKDGFLTFSNEPTFNVLKGDLKSKITQLNKSHWGMSTNLEAAFEEVLRVGLENDVKSEDMPDYVLILSDMQFNQATRSDQTANEMIKSKYEKAGYKMPKIVFWNLAESTDNFPVKYTTEGTALVSGYNTGILEAILSENLDNFSPMNVMLETLRSSRYDY